MIRFNHNPWLMCAFAAGIFYPFLVYFGRSYAPPSVFIAFGLGLIGMRLLGLRHKPDAKFWSLGFFIAALALLILMILDASFAVKAYPIVMSLVVAALFGFSLIYPPSLVERMARWREPRLSQRAVRYTRRVTIVWTVFLLANATVSAATAHWGSLAAWTLWNGLISYVLMGTLLGVEYIIRKRIQR